MLELNHVFSGYGRDRILNDVSVSFEPGKITAIGGLNGCGKSTLLMTATGLLTPTSGEVLLDKVPVLSLSPGERARRISYIPQGRNVPELTAFRMVLHGRFPYLGFPRRYRKEDLEAASRALEWVGASTLSERPMSSLSGGQRQKVYLALALCQDTEIVLMDEPTTYLDIKARFEVMEIAKRLAEMGKTVVLVLHDLDLLLRFSDRVILMEKGSVISEGTPAEVCANGSVRRVFGVDAVRTEHDGEDQYLFHTIRGEL